MSQDMQNTLRACEMDADEASADSEEEQDGIGHCNELLDELELREVSILRRMVQKRAVPIQIREKVHRLGRTAEARGIDSRS